MIGLWMADLYASGWVRKLQDHWKPTVAVEVCGGNTVRVGIIVGDQMLGELNRSGGISHCAACDERRQH